MARHLRGDEGVATETAIPPEEVRGIAEPVAIFAVDGFQEDP